MTTSPLRLTVERFGSMENATSSAPCGLGTALKETQAGRSAIDQVHSRSACTVSVPVPPGAANEEPLRRSTTPHLPASGLGESTDVDADPQLASIDASTS